MQSACAILYCRLWPVCLYNIFPHHLMNEMIFVGGGEITEHKMCVSLSLQIFSEKFLILRRIQ